MKHATLNLSAAVVLAGSAALIACAPTVAQDAPATAEQAPGTGRPAGHPPYDWPSRIENPKVLPAEIGSERLKATMRGFSRGLGVHCTFCHVGDEDAPLSTYDFASDAKPEKEMARGMIRMVMDLNQRALPEALGPGFKSGGSSGKPMVTCYSCHRGEQVPVTAPPPPIAQ